MTKPLIALGVAAMLVVAADGSLADDRSAEKRFFEARKGSCVFEI